jgi:predicted outer membrane repeat protein
VPVPNGSANVTITNCLFLSNTATNGKGGGLYVGDLVAQVTGTTIQGNYAHQSGGGVAIQASPNATFTECLIAENGNSWGGAGGLGCAYSTVSLSGVTLVGNYAGSEDGTGGLMSSFFSTLSVANSIVAFNTQGGVWTQAPATATFTCSDVFGNDGGDWTGDCEDQTGINGNISADPRFCGASGQDAPYSLQEGSPCLPDGNTCGVLMGALPLGCVTTGIPPLVPEDESWGKIKSLY